MYSAKSVALGEGAEVFPGKVWAPFSFFLVELSSSIGRRQGGRKERKRKEGKAAFAREEQDELTVTTQEAEEKRQIEKKKKKKKKKRKRKKKEKKRKRRKKKKEKKRLGCFLSLPRSSSFQRCLSQAKIESPTSAIVFAFPNKEEAPGSFVAPSR